MSHDDSITNSPMLTVVSRRHQNLLRKGILNCIYKIWIYLNPVATYMLNIFLMTHWSFLAVLHLLSVTCFDLCTLDLSGNQQVTTMTLHAFLGAAATAPERHLSLYIGGKCDCVSNTSTKVITDIHVTYKRGSRDIANDLMFILGSVH